MPTLLETAMDTAPGRNYTKGIDDQMVDLALAYISGTVTSAQAAAALDCSRQGAFQRLMTQLIRAVRSGRVHFSVATVTDRG